MAKGKGKKNNFIIQGGILAVASVISRVIGLIYRIPLTNIIGDEGNGIYSSAFNVYSIILMISSYSLPLAVSKLVSVRIAQGQRKNAYKIYKGSMIFAIVVGGIATALTFFGAQFLAGDLMKSPMSVISLKVLAPAILIVAVMGVMRGYFQGEGTTVPTAISQLLEQIINAIVSVAAAWYLFTYGEKVGALLMEPSYAAAYGSAGGTLGTVLGALTGLLFLLFIMSLYKRIIKKKMRKDHSRYRESWGSVYKALILTIVPVLLSTTVYNISSIIDQGIFNNIMHLQGYSVKEYNSLYGIYNMKYKTLSNVPIALASAMAASSVPSISGAFAAGNMHLVRDKIRSATRVTMVISIPCAIGLFVLAKPILTMLLGDSTDLASNLLRIGSVTVIFYSLSTLSNGILQGLNRMRAPVIHAVIALFIHIGVFVVMITGFKLNIYAMVYADIVFSFCMCILNALSIRKHADYDQEIVKTFIIPLVSAFAMGVATWGVYTGLYAVTHSNAIGTILSIGVGVVVYFVTFLLLKGMNREEIYALPLGRTLAGIATKLHLLK